MKSTKDKIMEQALELFSTKGYDGVSVQEIAEAVGIKAPSLYKHFRSKQDIFDSILAKASARYKTQAQNLNLDGFNALHDWQSYKTISQDELVTLGKNLFLYFLHDEVIAKTRRMLSLEQYNNSDLAKIYATNYIDKPLTYQSQLFLFLNQGDVEVFQNDIMALHFYAPIYLMLILCDTQTEREDEALETIERHIRQFSKIYRRELL